MEFNSRELNFEDQQIHSMPDSTWKQLCEAIMRETDPQKLLALVEELNRTLDQREKDLKSERGAQPTFE